MTRDKPNNKASSRRTAGILFSIAGLLWTIGALFSDHTALNISIGMMNVCVGMMFLRQSRSKGSKVVDEPPDESAG